MKLKTKTNVTFLPWDLPGGTVSASLHVCRSVCRRAEREIAPLVHSEDVDPETIRYINRLSDFLFTIARFAAKYDKREETIYRYTLSVFLLN